MMTTTTETTATTTTTEFSARQTALVQRYGKLLSELLGNAGSTGARRSAWPDSLLPATRSEIENALTVDMIEHSDAKTFERNTAMRGLLDQFRPHREAA